MPRSTDAYLPALPPDLIQAREQKLKKGARPQQGPSRPTEEILPSPHQEREEEKEEEEEGDYIGPAPAPASLDTEALEREQRIQEIESRIKPTTSKKVCMSGDAMESGKRTIWEKERRHFTDQTSPPSTLIRKRERP